MRACVRACVHMCMRARSCVCVCMCASAVQVGIVEATSSVVAAGTVGVNAATTMSYPSCVYRVRGACVRVRVRVRVLVRVRG